MGTHSPTPPRPPAGRQGPRPIALHLGQALAQTLAALAGLAAARAGALPWPEPLAADGAALAGELARAPAQALWHAVAAEGIARLGAALDGLEAYRRHPYRRLLPEPPALWRRGSARLLDYGGDGHGGAVLLVPSLVNRAHVLDLDEELSLARWLARAGVRTLLLDWGTPGPAERRFGLARYLSQRLEPALAKAVAVAGRRVALAGYCMGGNLALAAALRRPEAVAGLALLATPWDFHRPAPLLPPRLLPDRRLLRGFLEALGPVPVDLLQSIFASVDPGLTARKFRRFAGLDPDSAAARGFVAVEDWANDGVPLSPRVAEECLLGWYRDNRPAAGTWRVGRTLVAPERLAVPALLAVPGRDRLVPPESALALAGRLPAPTVLRSGAGHVGMLVGPAAHERLHRPLARWLGGLPA